jgi:redox-sensitive bicupin YhaK (pirin superfamily)
MALLPKRNSVPQLLSAALFILLAASQRTPSFGALAFSSLRASRIHPSHEHPSSQCTTFLRLTKDVLAAPINQEVGTKSLRQVDSIEQFARLPIWPIWSGVLLFLVSRVSSSLAASIEDALGGRVCPNFLNAQQTSPFVLMVHHRHSFSAIDPIRFIQRTFFPEGFPSHPHRGFVTVTYCLKGGMIHRDSLGIKQSYGADKHHDDAHVQWLTAAAGIQHEEMWDVRGNALWNDQELFQIWLNLPASHKMTKPKVQLLRRYSVKDDERIPEGKTPIVEEDGIITTVVCGEYNGICATIDCPTNAAILRVQFTKQSTWRHLIPPEHETAILYIRKGSVRIGSESVPVHHTAYLSPEGDEIVIESDGEADILLMSGEPLGEP